MNDLSVVLAFQKEKAIIIMVPHISVYMMSGEKMRKLKRENRKKIYWKKKLLW